MKFLVSRAVAARSALMAVVLAATSSAIAQQEPTYSSPKDFSTVIPATAVSGSVKVTDTFFGVAWAEDVAHTSTLNTGGTGAGGEDPTPANLGNVRAYGSLAGNVITLTAAPKTVGFTTQTIQPSVFTGSTPTNSPAGSLTISPTLGATDNPAILSSPLQLNPFLQAFAATSTPSADGGSLYTVNPFTPSKTTGTTTVSGSFQSQGDAIAAHGAAASTAYAFSYDGLLLQYKTKAGVNESIALAPKSNPTSVTTGQGANDISAAFDPVILTTTDENTGVTTNTTLLNTGIDVDGANSSITWDTTNLVTIDATKDADFVIDLSTGTQQGLLDLQIRNGVVVTSVATGFYLGVALPTVGSLTSTPFDFSLPPLTLDYSVADPNGDTMDVTLDMSTAGSAFDTAATDQTPPPLIDPQALIDAGITTSSSGASAAPLPLAAFAFPLAAALAVGFGVRAKKLRL